MQRYNSPSNSNRQRIIASVVMLAALLVPLTQGRGASAEGKPGSTGITNPGSPTTCIVPFLDVHAPDYFFDGVRYLFCQGAIGGYSDGTFRPNNTTTRAQLSKIVVMSLAWPLVNPPSPSFSDVAPGSTFYAYIETAKAHGVIDGYSDGTFKPGLFVTRSQLSKIVATSEGWPLVNPPSPSFNDVPPGSPFYNYIETAVARGVVSGYPDGSFRPGGLTNRGQVAKVVYYGATAQLTPQEQETIDTINQRRSALGLVTLRVDPALSRAARRHSVDIGPLGLCQHDGTDGTSPWDRADQAGYTGFAMGEVVGCNYPTALAVVDGWWASPGHHAILIDANARDIGCGWWINSSGYGWQTCLTGTPNP